MPTVIELPRLHVTDLRLAKSHIPRIGISHVPGPYLSGRLVVVVHVALQRDGRRTYASFGP